MTAVVRLYARPDCHLCEEARRGLEDLGREVRFVLEEVDIDSSDALLRRHLERIPVVEVDGTEVCELFLDVDAVKAKLATVA